MSLRLVLAVGATALALSGCSYDYLQRTDRVSYSSGDAVHANLEAETVNPSKKSMRVTTGLGKSGYVAPRPGTPVAGVTSSIAAD